MSLCSGSLTRRAVLAGAAGVAAIAAAPRLILAATPPHRFKHGAFEIMVVSDGHLVLPTSFLAPQAPQDERAALLKEAGHAGEQFHSATNVSLIRTPSDLILVDCGSGANFMPTAGKLAENLEAAGIARDKITKVVITHAHPDHVWGASDDLDELQFPEAAYFVSAAEWDFWHGDAVAKTIPEERHGFITGARRNLARMKDKLTLIKGGDDIAPGIRALDTSGHTPGHISIEIAGESGLLILGDAITHPWVSFARPEWTSPADHEPDRAIAMRKRLLDRLATDKMRLIGFHLPYPGIGIVERKDGGYRFVAA